MYESVHKYKFTLKSCACSVSMNHFHKLKNKATHCHLFQYHCQGFHTCDLLYSNSFIFLSLFLNLVSTWLKNDTKISIVLQEIMNS